MSSLLKRITREVFRHHSNPWSAWTRLLSVPLVFVPIWTRSWRQGAIVGACRLPTAELCAEYRYQDALIPRALEAVKGGPRSRQ